MVRPFTRSQHVLGSAALVCALITSSAVPAIAVVPHAASATPSTVLSTTAAMTLPVADETPVDSFTTPHILGNAVVGQQLDLAEAYPEGSQIQWLRDGAPLPLATAPAYQLVLDDACSLISARVTTPDGQSADSTPVGPVEVPVAVLAEPVVTGTYAFGKTLTVTAGALPSRATVHYQWLRDGAEIPGATLPTYTLGVADVGRAITVRVIGSIEACTLPATVSSSAAATLVTAGVLTAPTPTVTGTSRVGLALTVARGAWTSGTTLRQQWLRDGTAISGATSTSYRLTAADQGKRISVRVTGSQPGYQAVSKTSTASAAVSMGILKAPRPTITGTPRVGLTLTAASGTWTAGTRLRHQWLRDGAAITGATATTYRLTAADRGKRISVRVTGSLAGYTTVAKTSALTALVATGVLRAPTPTISGTPRVGLTLTAVRGSWTTGTSLRQQWLRNGVAITGATATTYRLTAADRGKRISVRVTGSQSGYTTVAKTSALTALVATGILRAPTPTISGTARAGYTLSAVRGSWTSGTTLRQQWLRNGVAITGATATSYRLTSADVGRSITVRVTGSKAGYTTVSRTSAAVRVATQAPPSSTGSCPAAYPIKGNADSGIYHVLGGRYYTVTKAEECFATRAAAERAGYRASKL